MNVLRKLPRPASTVRRRGALLLAVLICLFGIGMIGASLLRLASVQQRQMQLEQRRLQAKWLAEAALDRAAARMASDAGFESEVWTVPSEILGRPGEVRLTVSAGKQGESHRLVEVVAVFPTDSEFRAQASRRREIPVVAEEASR